MHRALVSHAKMCLTSPPDLLGCLHDDEQGPYDA
jgi:hypothetical protein